ncbi:acetyl-CoA acetyltransferase [Nonomuraea sp. NBC_01738]|uniref:thiolase C-terminal domain-containing protein n=1 Tax=Nonomuraea sp. NBC_01738 TaxID=2976003 RepID=UPI002E0D2469|nr:acetyl-CoA acetyltransferase [Nonomuraea sp. NBC_01738]
MAKRLFNFADRTAVAGVGYTPFTKDSGVSTLTLACRAILAALDDAGLTPADVDGLATHRVGDSAAPSLVGPALGIDDPAWYLDQFGGGSVSHAVVGQAALAVASGLAETVVCYRAINARSEFRMGRAGSASPEAQYQTPYGLVAPAQHFALYARAHMLKYGTTEQHFGQIAVRQRAYAVKNPRALMRTPITLDDHVGSRWITEPFRLLDCCLETDGACALVITTAERARSLRRTPVLVSAAAWGGGTSALSGGRADPTVTAAATLAPRLYGQAGAGPGDIDVAMLYDCFTYSVLVQLEDYGFCAKGEGGPFVASGEGPPVNTHGGFLSEGYVHGLNHVAEAVSQLRWDAGDRQVPGAETALSTAQPGYVLPATSALILRRDR